MGRGDRRTRRGKIARGSYGKARSKPDKKKRGKSPTRQSRLGDGAKTTTKTMAKKTTKKTTKATAKKTAKK